MTTRLANAKSFTFTPPTGGAITTTDIVEVEINEDVETHQHKAGSVRAPITFTGMDQSSITIKTTDWEVYSAAKKNDVCTAIAITIEGARKGNAGAIDGSVADKVYTIATGVVKEAPKVSHSYGAAPIEYSITWVVEQNDDGTYTAPEWS